MQRAVQRKLYRSFLCFWEFRLCGGGFLYFAYRLNPTSRHPSM